MATRRKRCKETLLNKAKIPDMTRDTITRMIPAAGK